MNTPSLVQSLLPLATRIVRYEERRQEIIAKRDAELADLDRGIEEELTALRLPLSSLLSPPPNTAPQPNTALLPITSLPMVDPSLHIRNTGQGEDASVSLPAPHLLPESTVPLRWENAPDGPPATADNADNAETIPSETPAPPAPTGKVCRICGKDGNRTLCYDCMQKARHPVTGPDYLAGYSAENLKTAMGSACINQSGLAQLLGIDVSNISLWVRGKGKPGPESAERLKTVLPGAFGQTATGVFVDATPVPVDAHTGKPIETIYIDAIDVQDAEPETDTADVPVTQATSTPNLGGLILTGWGEDEPKVRKAIENGQRNFSNRFVIIYDPRNKLFRAEHNDFKPMPPLRSVLKFIRVGGEWEGRVLPGGMTK